VQIIEVAGSKKPIFSWCPGIEQGALDQMIALAKLPFVEHCALMPDAHLGSLMPIGGVLATSGVIIPMAVGSDCGCGVYVIKTSLKKSDIIDVELRKKIHASVERGVPMGFSKNSSDRVKFLKTHYGTKIQYILEKTDVLNCKSQMVSNLEEAIYLQLGTLGSGNHFLSVEHDENDNVWLMTHSGSRNLGKRVGDYFDSLAKENNEKWYSVSPMPFLPTNTEMGKDYLTWMDFSLRFAFLNRQVMIDEMKKDIQHILPNTTFDEGSAINIHHNYASLEHYFGKNLWIHRKGAVLASKGNKGIIPGSMATASYIVEGLGNTDSLNSSSHGAGRTKGRKAFNVEMNNEKGIKEVLDAMEGVVYSSFGKATSRKGKDLGMLDLSEAPQAYKSIENVMQDQADLVKPIHKLMPLINWKDVGEE